MVKIKVMRRSQILINILIFLIFSFLFLHGQVAIYQEVSALKMSLFQLNLKSLYFITGLLALTAYGVLNLKSWTKYSFFLSVLVVIFFTVRIQLFEMSKISVLLLFIYVIISYYFYNFLVEELEEPCYVPSYSGDELFDPMLKRIDCELTAGKNTYHGYLTNWNDHSCFVKLDKKYPMLPKSINFKSTINGRIFMCDGSVVSKSKSDDGLGLYFYIRNDEHLTFGWKDFHQVLDEYGLQSESLK